MAQNYTMSAIEEQRRTCGYKVFLPSSFTASAAKPMIAFRAPVDLDVALREMERGKAANRQQGEAEDARGDRGEGAGARRMASILGEARLEKSHIYRGVGPRRGRERRV